MEKSCNSRKTAICRDVCYSLLMLLLGLFFCFPLATLAYFTYQTIAGRRQFCTLWIDVPGRLVILFICCYIAGICGFLPLSHRYRLRNVIVPFNVWSLRSWRRLFRNICFLFPCRSLATRLQRNAPSVEENLETPLLREGNQGHLYSCSPRRRRTTTATTPIDIPYPETYVPPVFISNPETTPRDETPEIIRSSNRSIVSIDPSVGDIVLPIMPKKSLKRHYIPEITIKESKSPDNRDRVRSKYRKKITETKWPGEEANAVEPSSDYQATTRERPTILNSDKKCTAITDDEKLVISRRQERRVLRNEIPEIHNKNDPESVLDAITLATDPAAASERWRHLDDRYFDVTDYESLVTTTQELQMPGNERSDMHITDDRFKILPRNELLSEINDQPTIHKGNLHLKEATCSNERKTPPEYCNTELQLSFPEIYNRNLQHQGFATNPPVARERSLDDKYFDESAVTTSQQELQISGNERLEVLLYTTDDRPQVLTRNELISETNDQPADNRNLYPRGVVCNNQRGDPPYKTEAQMEFLGARKRNLQPRDTTDNKEQVIPSKLHGNEAEMNYFGAIDWNRQPDREITRNERERVMRSRSNKTSPNFPRFPWIILRNPKGVPAKADKLHKKNLELEKREVERYVEMRPRKQLYLERSLSDQDSLQSMHRNWRRQIRNQLSRSHENINLSARCSYRTENISSDSAKSSDKCIEVKPKTSSGISNGNDGQTTNRCDATQNQEMENVNNSHARNLWHSFLARGSNLQEIRNANAGGRKHRCRTLSSQRFEVYPRIRSQNLHETEVKTRVKLLTEQTLKSRASDQEDSKRMTDETSPSSLSKFEKDTERTGVVKSVREKTVNENFNGLQLDDLLEKLTLVQQNKMHSSSEASAAVKSKPSMCTKTTDKSDKDISALNLSTKPSEEDAIKKLDVKIVTDSPMFTSEDDSDSDPNQS